VVVGDDGNDRQRRDANDHYEKPPDDLAVHLSTFRARDATDTGPPR
jgi:hypothetical protein